MAAEQYRVLVNDEEQHALWPAFLDVPAGWHEAGKSGSKEECMAFVRAEWRDMTPRSLRPAQG